MQGNTPLFKLFYGTMFFTALIPFIGYLFPFLPGQFLGFNQTGWAWMIMLAVTIWSLFNTHNPGFPIHFWIPWILYIIGYLFFDFSFLGMQLTAQYLLPLFVGIVASGFVYTRSSLEYLYALFVKFILVVILITIYGYFFRLWLPAAPMLPMTLSIAAAIYVGIYHEFKDIRYLFYFFGLMLLPVIMVTRMGILVFLVLFVFHFGENRISRKLIYGSLGLFMGIIVFFSTGFQEKTFYSKHGEFADISANIYESGGSKFNSSGRVSFYSALKPGLKENPLLGNGPRSDNEKLKGLLSTDSGEAHNDYLSVSYNYGWIGLSLLLLGFIIQFISLFKKYMVEQMWNRNILISSTLVLHLVFWLFMYSDNILKYTIFFPNFFFALVGIAYADYGKKKSKV